MNPGFFFRQLTFVTLPVAVILLFLQQLPTLKMHAGFSWTSLAFFVLLSIFMYFVGYRAVIKKNKFAFINAALMLTLFKMVLCVILVGAYVLLFQPFNRLFLAPFIGIYIIYTIFETHFMMKISMEDKRMGK